MRRNCKLDLQIPPPNPMTTSSISVDFRRQLVSWSNENQITISYGDATELQAIAILWVARRETEEKYNNASTLQISLHHQSSRGLSLKKSLQKFLQKRKDRIEASMPY